MKTCLELMHMNLLQLWGFLFTVEDLPDLQGCIKIRRLRNHLYLGLLYCRLCHNTQTFDNSRGTYDRHDVVLELIDATASHDHADRSCSRHPHRLCHITSYYALWRSQSTTRWTLVCL